MAIPAGVDLLRFATAGSVDDGKSTLIGRPYSRDRTTGAFIVLDEATGTTVAAGMAAGRGTGD